MVPTQYLTALPLTIGPDNLNRSQTEHVFYALALLLWQLESYGNKVNTAHQEALERILVKLTTLAEGQDTGRWAYDLDTGMGKSLSVACWIAAAHMLSRPYSVVVAAEQVEGLCKTKRDLLALGVPESSIGLRHSKRFNAEKVEAARLGQAPSYASEPSCTDEELSQRQYALVTHERLRDPAKLPTFNTWNGRDRDVVVWDEALLSTSASVVNADNVEAAVGWLKPRARRQGGTLNDAHQWLNNALQSARRTLGRHRSHPRKFTLPALDPDDAELAKAELQRVIERVKDAPASALHQCISLLSMGASGGQVRVGKAQTDEVVITFSVSVPDALERMVVLDASYPVHALERLDPTLQRDPAFKGRVKRYDNCTLHVWKGKAGKRALEAQFDADSDRAVSKEIAKVLEEMDDNRAAVLFTHKKYRVGRKEVDVPKTLTADLITAGLDPEKKVRVDDTTSKARFPLVTWGAAETATNEYAYTSAALFVSVFFRSPGDVYGMAVGQQRDLRAPVKHLGTLMDDLASHHVYQGASRTCARKVVDGQAMGADFYLRTPSTRIVDNLQALMPGLKVVEWQLRYHRNPKSQTDWLKVKAVKFLRSLPSELKKVSKRRIWEELEETEVGQRMRHRALSAAVEELKDWIVEGQSLVRVASS